MIAAPPARRRDIQGLRALAVIAVVLDHAIGWPSGGFAGVDVFFVASGFLITGMLLRDVQTHGRVRLGHFFAARVRRILPVALLALAVVTAIGFVVFNGPRAQQTSADAIWAALFVVNWRFAAQGTDYFDAAGPVSPLQHFWTLSVEEQFYLVWPLLVLLLVVALPVSARGRGAPAVVGCAALAVTGASLWWGSLETVATPAAAYFGTATRAWELAAGAALAVLVPLLSRTPALLGGALAWAGAGGVVASFFVLDANSPMPVPGALLPVGATLLVLAGGVAGDPRHRWLFPLTNPVAAFIGDMSYSLYVWHFPVIVFAAVLLPASTATTAIVLAVIAVVSVVSYLAVEQPVHRSPLLRSFRSAPEVAATSEPAAAAGPVAAAPPAASLPAAAAVRMDTRPPGWQPGRRYFPGSPLRTPSIGEPASDPSGAAAVPLPVPEDAAPAAPLHAAADASRDAPAEPSTTPRDRRHAAWASWRERYRVQAASALGALVVAGLAVVLALQYVTGSAILPRFDLPTVAAGAPAADTDAVASLQAQLADAASATAWPALDPSMETVLTAGSGSNPAAACFSPDTVPDSPSCTWGDANAPHHLYLVGDSTAMAYAPAFRRIAESSGGTWRITTVGLYGCRFTDVLVANDGAGVMDACPGRKDQVAAAITADRPDAVVVTDAYTLGRTSDGRDLSAAELAASVRAETARYAMPGRIVYLAPPPEGVSPGVCFSPATGPASCLSGVDQTWHDLADATAAAAATDGDRTIDSLPLVCWQGVCPAFAGTTPVRYDQTHLTPAYAEKIAPALHAELVVAGVM